MAGRLGFTLLDNSDEKTNFQIYTGEVTAVSLPGLLTQVGALRTAVEGITLGTVHKESLSVFDTVLSNARPASLWAQRELKWLVVYEDVTAHFDDPVDAIPNEAFGRRYQVEIGTADLDLLETGEEKLDLADPAVAAFVTAFETTARSPAGGAVNVIEIRLVGRRS